MPEIDLSLCGRTVVGGFHPGKWDATAFDPSQLVPAFYSPDASAAMRVLEFFTTQVRNVHTRKAYTRAAGDFALWCERRGISCVRQVLPVHVASYLKDSRLAPASVAQRLAALRMLFDWLVVGQVLPSSPATSVRGPRHSAKGGKAAVLDADEVRALVGAIDISTPMGLRDRALIGLMVYTFCRVGAAVQMRVEDVYIQSRQTWVRLLEKGGKRHEMPCHHNLESWLREYMELAQLGPRTGYLFRSAAGRTGQLTDRPMAQADVFRMVGRRALAAGVRTQVGCHSFRATGITQYLLGGGKIEVAQRMANHESARTTSRYDRRTGLINLAEVERILI